MSKEDKNEESSEDASLKMLNAKRMLDLRRRANLASAREVEKQEKKPRGATDKQILQRSLIDRGNEVLASAEASYPSEMRILIPKLADLIRQGKVSSISGGELLQFLRAIGLRVSVATSISVEEHGKFVSLADKLRQSTD
jgi:DNA-binding TFAR19-related protein (PDSD5 family)